MSDERTTRRAFLHRVGAGAGAVSIGGCGRPPRRRRVPWIADAPEQIPGVPLHYATAIERDGAGFGVLARCREGRPIKLEGNRDHPASLGGTGPREQAVIRDLYDPRRALDLTEGGEPRELSQLCRALAAIPRAASLRLLLPRTSSPLRDQLLTELVRVRPRTRLCLLGPGFDTGAEHAATRRVFGRSLVSDVDFTAIDRLLVLDGDPFGAGPMAVRDARAIARRRRSASEPVRIWAAGPRPNCTTALADRVLACRGGAIPTIARAVLEAVADDRGASSLHTSSPTLPADRQRFVDAAVASLLSRPGRALVVVGPRQDASVHAIAIAINALLGTPAQRWRVPEAPALGEALQSPAELAAELEHGEIDVLVAAALERLAMTPADLGLAARLRRARRLLAWPHRRDAVVATADWVIPAAHELEGWGDIRAHDGTITIQQPLLDPIWGGCTIDELLAWLVGDGRPERAHRLVHASWARRWGRDWQARMELALQRGVIADSAWAIATPALDARAVREACGDVLADDQAGIEIGVFTDDKVAGGRLAANAWLQELPDPVTKQTWGNALLVAPALAARHGLRRGDRIEITVGDARVVGPVLEVPGHADDAISIAAGYGLAEVRHDDVVIGVAAQPLLHSSVPGYRSGARISPTGGCDELAITQDHGDQRDRGLARSVAELEPARPRRHLALADRPVASPQWGMVIDLGLCNGCSACVVACQAENNIATVGFREVVRGREMHWLRIDRYHDGERPIHQPMACQHCEYAPCEYVCPVNATVHAPDGLNEMVYNRCVGTRFCSNNCPYHVRRFNWFDYVERDELALQKNPDVTVRERGVMEKCTYCVQRIRRAEIAAAVTGSTDEVVTACQQACPTEAIVFGDLADPDSAVARARNDPRAYAVLGELGTEPRTRYLARPNHEES